MIRTFQSLAEVDMPPDAAVATPAFDATTAPATSTATADLGTSRLWQRFHHHGIPEYLARNYWWAYLSRPGMAFFDWQPVVNLILIGQYRRLMDMALARIDRDSARTLQVACVYGQLTPRLAQHLRGGTLDVVDVAPAQLGLCARKLAAVGSEARLVRMDAECLALADGSYDHVLMFCLLHEVPPATRAAALGEALRVLRRGGRMVIVDFGEALRGRRSRILGVWRRLLGRLEPFLGGFVAEDLEAGLRGAAERVRRRIGTIEQVGVLGGLYRVVEIRVD
jgi:ubiquinone/menaquinone biosynthesis C-methylase UbiE